MLHLSIFEIINSPKLGLAREKRDRRRVRANLPPSIQAPQVLIDPSGSYEALEPIRNILRMKLRRSSTKVKTTGMTRRLRNVEVIRPPITTVPIG